MRKFCIILSVAFCCFAIQEANSEDVRIGTLYDGTKYVSNQVVVLCLPDAPPLDSEFLANGSTLNLFYRQLGIVKINKFYPGKLRKQALRDLVTRMYILTLDEGIDCLTILDDLNTHPYIQYAEIKTIPELYYMPDDPLVGQQWFLSQTQTFSAWDYVRGDTTRHSIIGIVDAGINYNHADLAGNMWINDAEDINENGLFDQSDNNGVDDDDNGFIDDVIGWDFAENDNDPMAGISHGTGVAGCASEVTDNGVMGAGIGFSSRLMAMKGISDGGVLIGAYECIVYAADNGANVINCSWGVSNYNQYEQDIISAAWAEDVIIVGAGGEGNQLTYPAAYDHVMAVTATDQNDHKASFAPYGYYIDIAAPGVQIAVTWSDNFSIVSGTSFATGLVSGLAGLVRAWYPEMTNDLIQQLIQDSADSIDHLNPGYSGQLGAGRINAANCVMTGISDNNYKPDSINVISNYPNPFNSQTSIRFQLPDAAVVDIDIYDIMGRKVELFRLGKLSAGHKSIIWDADHCSSGIYFCNICINSSVNTHKMTLLK